MATETNRTAAFRKLLIPSVHADKMSNPYRRGIPDCYYSGSIRDLWCEHKVLDKPPQMVDLTKLTTRLQLEWLIGRYEEGRNVSLLVFTPRRHGVLFYGLDWLLPVSRDNFFGLERSWAELAQEIIDYCGTVAGA